jgi:cellobiose phosphorylase
METGDPEFLSKILPFYDGGEATVYERLRRAVAFSRTQLGERGLPLMLRSDWNDALFRVCRQGKGESFWTAMQLGVVLPMMAELAGLAGFPEHATEYRQFYAQQKELVNRLGWDGEWFRRAIMDDGNYLGTRDCDQAQIWLNSQSWSVLSGMADGDRGRQAMDSVARYLDSEIGIAKVHPPITTFPRPEDPLTNYNPGTGENGSVFCHANTWAIIAECLLGRGDRAYKYYRQLIPAVTMEKVGLWRYKAEPYVYASNLFGPMSDKPGLANVSWLTGTAAWMYVAATQYILGIRPEWDGLRVVSCLPSGWDGFRVRRAFRGQVYNIEVKNTAGQEIWVNGKRLDGNLIRPASS